MPNRFDLVIQQARAQGTAHYEADPKSFGGPGMFRDCLLLVLRKYPDMEMTVSGSDATLSALGLAGSSRILGTMVPVRRQETDVIDFVRLTFEPRRARGRAAPAAAGAEHTALPHSGRG